MMIGGHRLSVQRVSFGCHISEEQNHAGRLAGGTVSRVLDLFAQRLQFGNRLQVPRPPRRPLCRNPVVEIQTLRVVSEERDVDGMIDKIVVRSTANDFTEQVDVAGGGRKREVESGAEGRCRPLEGKPARGSAQIRLEGVEGADYSIDIPVRSVVADVDVLSEPR